MEKGPQLEGGKRSRAPGAGSVTALRSGIRGLPVSAWDVTDEEISEWQHSRSGISGMVLAGYTAAAIRDGRYDSGRELFPLGSGAYREVTRETVDFAMTMLMERGMVRKSGDAWYPVTPGRLAPSACRAVAVLLACRQALPAALATELASYQATLEATELENSGGCQAATGATIQQDRANRTMSAG